MDLFYGIVKPFVCVFFYKYRGLVRKIEMRYDSKDIGSIRMIGVVAKVVNYRF